MTLKLVALCFLGLALSAAAASAEPVKGGGNPVVVIETSAGDIKAELFEDKAPITVKNFLDYADSKHYDGTIFHRVIDGFMIQGGGMEVGMKEKKTKDPIKNEASNGVLNARGTLAMARTRNPDSATAQFFINHGDNSRNLGPGGVDATGYAVFGRVVEGMDVVDKIAKMRTGDKGAHQNVPVEDVVIKSIRRAGK